MVAREKDQDKTCSTGRSRQGGFTKNCPSRRLLRDRLTTASRETGVFRNVTRTSELRERLSHVFSCHTACRSGGAGKIWRPSDAVELQ